MNGYEGLPADAQAIDADGWLHTGDLGFLDPAGYLHLSGRIKDVIIRGGENIAPAEIEAELTSIKGISDAKVMGAPHAIFGESVEACVTFQGNAPFDEGRVFEALRTRMPRYKIPTHIFSYREFPLNVNGKLNQRALYVSMLGRLHKIEVDEELAGGITVFEITVKNFEQLQNTADEFIEKVNRQTDKDMNTYSSQTIYEAYPQVFHWLELLDINVWIILVLMVCVAGFTMISGLLIIILERTQMIGVLKAVGARNKTIRHTFLWFAAFIIGQGLIIGNLLGLGIIALQKYSGLVKLDPQTYYVSEAPMEINIPLFVLLNIATLIICVFVLIAPSYFISHIHPAKSMRYE